LDEGVLTLDVTTDKVNDFEVLPELITDASNNRKVAEAFMDRTYNTYPVSQVIRLLGFSSL
jgi:hypothetical protein